MNTNPQSELRSILVRSKRVWTFSQSELRQWQLCKPIRSKETDGNKWHVQLQPVCTVNSTCRNSRQNTTRRRQIKVNTSHSVFCLSYVISDTSKNILIFLFGKYWTEMDLNESEMDLNEPEMDLNEFEMNLNDCEHFFKG